ncbi:MAG: hypothetical protein QXE51_03255 [Nitrososphaeria archaeon]
MDLKKREQIMKLRKILLSRNLSKEQKQKVLEEIRRLEEDELSS